MPENRPLLTCLDFLDQTCASILQFSLGNRSCLRRRYLGVYYPPVSKPHLSEVAMANGCCWNFQARLLAPGPDTLWWNLQPSTAHKMRLIPIRAMLWLSSPVLSYFSQSLTILSLPQSLNKSFAKKPLTWGFASAGLNVPIIQKAEGHKKWDMAGGTSSC